MQAHRSTGGQAAPGWLRTYGRAFAGSEAGFLLLAIASGVAGGVGAWAFVRSVAAAESVILGLLPALLHLPPLYRQVFGPALGGLLAGALASLVRQEERGGGASVVVAALEERQGRIRLRDAAVAVAATSIASGAGQPIGREGPMALLGAALSSGLSRLFGLSDARTRLLLACGAAGALARGFNTPLAGVFFAVEVLGCRFSLRSAVLLGAAVAAAVSTSQYPLIGYHVYPQTVQGLTSYAQIPFYAVLGVIGALGGILFTLTLAWSRRLWDAWRLPLPAKAALGGALAGAISIPFPQVMGSGIPVADTVITAQGPVWLFAALAAAKVLACAIALGSGTPGGVLGPTVFVGGSLGGGCGRLLLSLWPALAPQPSAYGLVGMGALFAGAARAPFTGLFLVWEFTHDHTLVMPLFVAVTVSTVVSRAVGGRALYGTPPPTGDG